MIGMGIIDIRLYVTGWTHFQVDLVLPQVFDKLGIMFAVTFRLTKNILVLWPIFQPMGQLVTLVRDQLTLPPLAALGFVEVLIVMFVLVWLANRYYRKHLV
jgi:hypothetical protein